MYSGSFSFLKARIGRDGFGFVTAERGKDLRTFFASMKDQTSARMLSELGETHWPSALAFR